MNFVDSHELMERFASGACKQRANRRLSTIQTCRKLNLILGASTERLKIHQEFGVEHTCYLTVLGECVSTVKLCKLLLQLEVFPEVSR